MENFNTKLALAFRDRGAGNALILTDKWPHLDIDHFHFPIVVADHQISRSLPGHTAIDTPALLDQPSGSPRLGYRAKTVAVIPAANQDKF